MNGNLEDYISSISSPEPPYLSKLLRDSYVATVNGRMNAGHIQGRLLKLLVQMSGAKKVLELGTFCGYSALCLAEGLPDGGNLVTIEIDDEREDFIREHISGTGLENKISLMTGDCIELMKDFQDNSFDMVFVDADKRHYCEYLEAAEPILRPGGFLLADNTLWDGHVLDPEYHDRQTNGIREFNAMLASRPGWECVVLPLRDGFTIARKLPLPAENIKPSADVINMNI